MADSDEDYIATDDEEIGAHNVGKGGRHRGGAGAGGGGGGGGGGSGARSKNGSKPGGTQKRERWEDIKRSWDNVVEGEDGSLSSTVAGLLEAGKRKRLGDKKLCPPFFLRGYLMIGGGCVFDPGY